MRMPQLAGVIERRLLVNYRADPDVVAAILPEPFRPQLVGGMAVAGICMIRLGAMRPRSVPAALGVRSENAAHRIAVEWTAAGSVRTGVYIPRRDSDSLINVLVGGRLYPGAHHRASFDVRESDDEIAVAFRARDQSAEADVVVTLTDELTSSRLFDSVESASAFFERGAVGFSATKHANRFDGLELQTSAWQVEAGTASHVRSSFFEDRRFFPAGSVELDCALVMRRVPVTWQPLPALASRTG